MIMQDKGIKDATMMKLVVKILKRSDLPKGFKINNKWHTKTITREELIEFVEALTQGLDKGDYGAIHRCDTCGRYGHPGRKDMRGICPQHKGSYLKYMTDFCSYWTPMTKEQQNMKERIDELFKPQNERIGDVHKDSQEGHHSDD